MEFLFRSRGAGKRQVKPSQDVDMLADQMAGNQGDGSSDDSDFFFRINSAVNSKMVPTTNNKDTNMYAPIPVNLVFAGLPD